MSNSDNLRVITKTIDDKNYYYIPYNKPEFPWLISVTDIHWDPALYNNNNELYISQPLLIEASGENIDISTNKFINLYSDTIFKQNLNICGEIIFNNVTINDISSNLNNLTLTGELKGPSNFIINPSPDNNKGTVTIKGSLIVDGSTTIINSTIVDISDKTLLLASNATNATSTDRAGLEISGNKNILYDLAKDAFVTNISFETTYLKVNNTIISKKILAIDDDGNQIDVTQIATEGTSVLKLQIDASFDNVDISGKLHANDISCNTFNSSNIKFDNSSIALGYNAGTYNLGKYSIAIGNKAVAPDISNIIVLNATGNEFIPTISNGLYIAPIRKLDPPTKTSLLQYTASYEIVESSNININTIKTNNFSTNVIGKITPVYAKGVGDNLVPLTDSENNMFVKIGGTIVAYSTYATRPAGLTLTIINAKTHEHVSSDSYTIYNGNGEAAHMTNADNLGNALLSMSNDQIGILTSYGAFENTNSTILKKACYKLGLTRLAAALDNIAIRAPYVSIFYGSGNVDNAGNQALEIMKTNSSTSAYATLSTFLIDDAFIGQQITNALYNPHSESDNTGPSVFVDYIGNVGIGTTDPNTTLDVSGNIKATGNIEANRNNGSASSYFGKAAIGKAGIGNTNDAGFCHINLVDDMTSYALKQDSPGNTFLNAKDDEYISFRIGNEPKMHLTSSGNFGINTGHSAAEKLEVNGNIKVTGTGTGNITATGRIEAGTNFTTGTADDSVSYFGRARIGGGGYPSLQAASFIHRNLEANHTTDFAMSQQNQGTLILNTKSGCNLHFKTNGGLNQVNNNTSIGDRMTIYEAGTDETKGFVGINVYPPTERLHVNGNIKADENIIAGDTIQVSNAKIMCESTFYNAAMFGYNMDDSKVLNSQNYAIAQLEDQNNNKLVTRINSEKGGRIEFWSGGRVFPVAPGGVSTTDDGVEHARFDESGNFGIGFTDPTEKLDVNGNIVLNAHDNGNGNGIFFRRGFNPGSSTDNLSIYNCSILTHAHEGNNSDGLSINGAGGVSICTNSNTTRIERFRVAKNGNVGIGFTDPTEKLDVNGNIVLNAAANGVGKGIYFRRNYSPGGTNSSEIYNCSVLTENYTGGNENGLSINGFDGVSICTGNSSTRQERIRVANNGNVGIGTINPACKLHVEGAIALRPQLMPYDIDRGTVSDTINRENTYIAFAPNAGSDWAYLRYLGGSDSIRIALDFHDNGNDAGFEIRDIQSNIGTDQITTRFKVQRGGNVGIGTDNPTAKLDVNGNIKATGNIEANRNATSTSYFGKAAIGEAGTHAPNAGFSHINHAVGTTGHALQQDVDGNTYLNAQTDEYIRFDIGGQPKMILDNTGNFGIGTTDPYYKLHVNGNIKVDDTILAHTGSYQKASQIGKAMIGGFTTSNHNSDVYFSNAHYHNSTDGYGMRISQTGQTVLNSAYDTNLYFSISGDSKMIIDKSGNVGIGTDDPICKLDVNGAIHLRSETIGTELRGYKVDLSNRTHTYIAFGYAGSNDDWAYLRQIGGNNSYNLALDFHDDADDAGFVIRDVNSNATDTPHNQAAFPDPVITRFKVERGGNVGIGTDNPDYRLHVIGDIKVDQTILAHTDSTTAASQIGKAMIGAVPGATSDVYFSNAGSHTSDKYGMRLSNTGQTVLNSALNHNLYFCIAGLSKMILDKNGNIGINTIYPSEKLDVNGNIVLNAAGTDNDKGIFFRQGYNPGGTNTTINNRIYNCSILTHSHVGATSDGLSINGFDGVSICTDSNATRKERFRVASNGNVGIGTTSPNAKLHVVSGSGFDNTTTFKVLNAGEITIVRNHTRAPFINTNMNSGYPSLRLGQGSTDYTVIQGGQNQDSYFNSGGNLGIGTTSPNNRLEVIGTSKLDGHVGIGIDPEASNSLYKLKVNGQIHSTGLYAGNSIIAGTCYISGVLTATTKIEASGTIQTGSDTSEGKIIIQKDNDSWTMDLRQDGGNTDAKNLYFTYSTPSLNTSSGTMNNFQQTSGYIYAFGTSAMISFTGQHRSKFEGEFTTELVGLIVESTGKYIEFDGSIAPKIDEALPCVKLTSSARSKRVYGVLSNIEGETRESIGGIYISVYPKKDGINRVFVNSLGEGSLWVINTHNLENGDYVCSSNVPGYGELQDDDLLHSYTVAKITMDVDWSNLPEWLETRKVTANGVISETGEFTAAFVGVTYHCG